MNFIKNKNAISMLTILLILSFTTSMMALPNANAQSTPREFTTYPFVDAIPHTAGVGQPVLINWGLLNFLFNVRDGWNVTLQITHPNGKVENVTGMTWSTGSVGRKMSFAEPGNYTLQCIFDGEYYVYNTVNNAKTGNYKPSKSDNVTLQVLEGYWKADHPGHTLPTEYWSRPVDSQLREWYSIMGSWLYSRGDYNNPKNAPYNNAPESAHILWTMDIGDVNGGLAGGDSYTSPFQAGDAYEGRFYGAVIVAGVLYYNREFWTSGSSTVPYQSQMVVAVDLHTGKVLWERNFAGMGNARIAFAQILTYISENSRGSWSYLWIGTSGNMYAIEPKTGELRYNMTNVPGGTIYYGPSGELLKYSVTIGTDGVYRLAQWNSTYTVASTVSGLASAEWGITVHTRNNTGDVRSFNGANGYDINVTIPGLTGSPGSIVAAFPEDRLILSTTPNANGFFLTGISLTDDNRGYMLFNRREFKAPAEWEAFDFGMATYQTGWISNAFSQDDLVGVFWARETRKNYGFSLETGRLLWETETRIFADAWAAREGIISDGKFITVSVGGIVHCYDVKTGEELWTYENTDKYNESYHGENWWTIICFVSDGKAYFGHFAHSPTIPLPRGAPFFALDIETGEVVWKIDGAFRQSQWGNRAIIGDSIIATQDYYDARLYAIGKGPSEMTVAMSNAIVTAGSPVLVSGTVMDVSPGTQSDMLQMRFPKGVPAVSDESMSEWMLYVYKQFSRPMDTTGVEITVFAQQDNNVIDIGTAVSDANGRYSITWIPPADTTGEWDIYAYFSGSASYYGSYAKTETAVFAAPEVPPPVETPPYEWYIIGVGIAIIAVVLIGILLILKKIDKKQ
ncbi:MAG: PQQ-binding-like beta-propeller repeat protein [Candidatus Bathyarchaeota archaeon]|nr:PQQ-binding-like beta-propeller repeat protein [Candidatus Termiticorpusculum sp.]